MKKNILSFWLFVLLNSLLTSFASAQNNSEWIDAWNTKTVTIGTTLGTFSPNTWYFFFQGRPAMGSYELPSLGEVPSNKGGVLADNGVGNPVVKKHIVGLNGCRASNVTTFLVRFLPVPDKEGVYYIQFGTGNYMGAPSGSGNNSSFICESDVNSACEFNVYNIDDTKPGYFACNVYDMGVRVDNQGTGNRVVTWNSGRRDMTTGDNGVWNIIEVIWDDLKEPVNTYNPDHPFTEYPSLYRHDLAYFDYDGDGKMEMYGFYHNEENDRTNPFGIMDESTLIKTLSLPNVLDYNGVANALKMMIYDRPAPIIANGKGDINIGNFILRQDDSAEDISDKVDPISSTQYGKMLFSDLDNDGYLDGVKKTSIQLQQQDGSFRSTPPILVQDSAYLAYLKTISNKGTNPLSFDGMVISGFRTGTISSSGISRAIDLNGDGRLDLLKENDWTAYISCGDNSYIHLGFNGEIYPYDLNGDGILDYLLYDYENVYIVLCDSRGQTTQKQIFSNSKVKDFVCRDFDHDGDVDVLAYIVDSSNTYFVFMRNDGNGSFKKKEAYLGNLYTLRECKDYDADGLYEVLLCRVSSTRYNTNSGSTEADMQNCIIKICKDFTLSDVSLPIPYNLGAMKWDLGDFDNDGFTDYHLVNGFVNTYAKYDDYVSKNTVNKDMPYMVGHFYPYQEKRNTAPQKMSKPSVTLDENTGFLRIVWERGEDAETSACDLTYEVRIGTAPGKGDILCAPSIADGRRRVPVDGAMGTQTQTLFNIAKHPAGSYYIAVQAVDAGGLGGAWSDEAVYENTYTAPTLIADNTLTSTAETVTIYANEFQDDVTYEWSATNGEVISQEGKRAVVKFHAAGVQNVMLTSIYRGARYQSEPIKIEVQAFKRNENASDYYSISESLDLNQDGYPDGFNYSGFLLVNNGKGFFSKYPKSFNSDLKLYPSRFIDLNRDGFPDILGGYDSSQKGNIFINDQEGDFEFSLHMFNFEDLTFWAASQQDKDIYLIGGKWVDFSNTNDFNILTSDNTSIGADGGWLKTNDFYTYSFMGTHEQMTGGIESNVYIIDVCDINRDGFWDVVYMGYTDYNGYTLFAMMNNADGSFSRLNLLEQNETALYDDYGSTEISYMRDINNDGVLDYIDCRDRYVNKQHIAKILIYCGSISGGQYRLQLSKVINADYSIAGIQDIDNNGYLDFCLGDEVLLFDHNLNYQCIKSPGISNPFLVTDGTGYPQMHSSSSIKNEVPKAPSAVSVRQTEAGMVINWSDAEDDHTPAVQMRYNVSGKRKAMNGDDSYIISPMNGGDGKAALVFPWYYKQSTTMTIPKSALTAGETYEVQVQAIDLWNQWSPMTNPVEITISAEEGVIVVPDVACVNRETEVTYTGVLNAEASFSFGEDSQYKRNGTTFNVTWSTGGVKDITIGNHHSQIFVREPIDVSFSLPDDIFVGGDLPIDVNHEMATQGSKGNFRFVASPKGARVSVDYTPGEKKAWLRFNKPGHYEIEAYCEDEVLGDTYVLSFEAKEAPKATIDRVTADNGHYTLRWTTSEIQSAISKVIIYKESNRLNQFVVLDTVDIATGQYTDLTSAPHVVSARYKIALLSDGNQTFESKVHKPLHVMIASAAGGGYNLMWNPYEGLKVDNYRIWRGTSKDDMELLTQIAGSLQSFTDTEVLDGEVFYAVSFTPVSTAASVKGLLRAPNDAGDIFSNIISTRSAANLIPATSLFIVAPSEECVLTEENNTLQLNYQLLPVSCTCSQLSWSIVEGESLATISQDGLLTAKEGTGSVRVRVSTIDGSNLSDVITVLVNKQVLAESIVINETQLSFTSKDETAQLSVSIMPENAADKSVIWKSSNNRVASVTEKGLVTAVSSGTATITVTTNDGSNLSAECFVSVDIPDDRLLVETFMLYCKRGYVGFDGTYVCGTTDENASQFALIDYGGTNYLYDVTNSAFVVHTANMKAATTGNPLLESTTDISKAVTGLNWGTTGYNVYPWYLEDCFGNWLNMDKKPRVYMNTWRDFEGANGGNTYQKVIVESSYDATEALQILENYFNPKSTVTFVFKEPNTTSQSQPIPVLTGTVIDEVPAELRKGYCSYEMSPTIVHTGNNIVNVTVSYDLPFTISTDFESATWYYAKIRNYYYLNRGASEPYYPTSDNEENDNFKWAFMGTPHTGFVILNKAAGEDMRLTKDGGYVVMRKDGSDRWDLIENGAGFNVLRQGSIADFITQMNNSSGPLGIWTDQRGMDQIGSQWLLEFAESGENSYMLTYIVDGEEYKTSRVTYGTVLTPETAPSKEGYTFSGWSVIPTTMPSHDVIVVGSFTANKYKVRYYVGEQLWAEDEVVYGSKLTLRDYTPADANRYSFAGWDGVKFETMPAKDIEYRAMIVDGIGGLNADTNVIEAIYDGTGRKLSKMQRGVNVLRMKDGTMRKVFR